jgi:arabinofuranosyltransferase
VPFLRFPQSSANRDPSARIDLALRWLLVGAGAALLLAHTTFLTWFICDDAYISFRYALNLARHGEPFYNPGEAVEGYSNFLWVVFLAISELASFSMRHAAHLGSVLSALWILVSLHRFVTWLWPATKDCAPGHRRTILAAGLMALAAFGPFAFWVSAGLETMLFGALLTAAVVSTLMAGERSAAGVKPALLWAACALTRPEGALLGAAALSFLGFLTWKDAGFRFRSLWRPATGFLLFAALVGAHLIWRRTVYGQWLPMTYHTKISGIDPAFLFKHGVAYAHAFFTTFRLYWFLPLLAGVWLPQGQRGLSRGRRAFLLTAGLFLLLGAHIVRSGGDFMAMFRFFAPIWPLFIMTLLPGIVGWSDWLAHRLSHPRWSHPLTAIMAVLFLLSIGQASWRFSRSSLASERPQFMMESIAGMVHFAQDREKVGRALRRVLPEAVRNRTLMVVGGAGAIAFESRILHVVDTFGLTDPVIARKKVRTGSFTKPGHLKQASWAHVRSKNADILCNPNVAWLGSGAPPERVRSQLERQWPGYVTFCLLLPLSAPGRGTRRTHYCCLRKQDRLEQLTLRTVVP